MNRLQESSASGLMKASLRFCLVGLVDQNIHFQKKKRVVERRMDPGAARTARESLDLAFGMSNILETGLDRHTLSVLIALCDLGLNPEALAAVIKELRREASSPMGTTASTKAG